MKRSFSFDKLNCLLKNAGVVVASISTHDTRIAPDRGKARRAATNPEQGVGGEVWIWPKLKEGPPAREESAIDEWEFLSRHGKSRKYVLGADDARDTPFFTFVTSVQLPSSMEVHRRPLGSAVSTKWQWRQSIPSQRRMFVIPRTSYHRPEAF